MALSKIFEYDEIESLVYTMMDQVQTLAAEGLVSSHEEAMEAIAAATAFIASAPEAGAAATWWRKPG